MEPNQIRLLAAAVPGDRQQVLDARESRFARQIISDVIDLDRRDGIHDDMAIVHLVAAMHLDVGTSPDADAAPDSPPSDTLTEMLRKNHLER